MNIDKKIGIWGFGIVGKAALAYLAQRTTALAVMDRRPLTPEEYALLDRYNATFYPQEKAVEFFTQYDAILPSPGIDIRPYRAFAHKWISELDLFAQAFNKPIIAITGTVGKTTTAGLLAHILEHQGWSICLGGNIGIGSLELLDKHTYDYAILEVSSFQLELSKLFAPHIAVWTNFFPNHLDRHGTVDDYYVAKENIMTRQGPTDYAVIPLNIADKISASCRAQRILCSEQKPSHTYQQPVWYLDNNHIMKLEHGREHTVLALENLPHVTFASNLVTISAVLELLNIPQQALVHAAQTFQREEHRMEKVITFNGIDIYNDSKSTLAQATLAAVQSLSPQPIVLIVGGISKGVDRAFLFQQLPTNVKKIFCFGKEAEQLYAYAQQAQIPCQKCTTLEEVVHAVIAQAEPGDAVVLSPAGASYDLFAHYQERGAVFKKLIHHYTTNPTSH